MYRFLLAPRWIVAHVLVAAVVCLFVGLGFWQLDRHDERRAHNALLEERMAADVGSLETLAGDWDRAAYRRVQVTGTYETGEELLLSPRSLDGRPGHHVLTPLVLDGGDAVLVDRGWVPYEAPPLSEVAPVSPQVTVTGLVFPDEPAVRFAPDIPEGHLDTVSRVDVDRLQEQVSAPLLPVYVQLADQRPNQEFPVPADPPPVEAGNHLSYAAQWFMFATIALGGYPLLVRKSARGREEPARDRDLAVPLGR